MKKIRHSSEKEFKYSRRHSTLILQCNYMLGLMFKISAELLSFLKVCISVRCTLGGKNEQIINKEEEQIFSK